ncbi:MAG: O-antigen ligase family protein [Ignavibacteria bacterium]|nr:O-antigen ligase family protein [Ignavibacteria bacterium]
MKKVYNISFALTYFTQFLFGYAFFYFFNYGITAHDLNIIFAYILLLISFFLLNRKLIIAINYPNMLFFAFNFMMLFTILGPLIFGSSSEIIQNIKTTFHYYYIVAFILLLFSEYLEPKSFLWVVKWFIVLMLIFNLFGIYQLFARAFGLPFAWVEYSNRGIFSRLDIIGGVSQASLAFGAFVRATSIFTEPTVLASYNVYLLIFLMIPWIQFREGFVKNNKLLLLLIIINLVTLFLTFSLTGIFGAFVVLLVIFLIEYFQSYKFLFRIILIAIVPILITNFFVAQVFDFDLLKMFTVRIENILTLGENEMGGESFSGRFKNALSSIHIWTTAPVLGVGLGLIGYQKEFVDLFSDTTSLSILAEAGIFNFLLFNAMMFSLFFASLKLYRRVRDDISLSLQERKLIGIAPYIIAYEIFRCSFTANILVYFLLWMNLAFVFFVLNYYGHYVGVKYSRISFK